MEAADDNANDGTCAELEQQRTKGVAGRIDYAHWDKVAADLVAQTNHEDDMDEQAQRQALGLDGKYARSQAEQEEREKLRKVKHTKQQLEKFQTRETALVQQLTNVFDTASSSTSTNQSTNVVRITRDNLPAGKRVVTIADSTGQSIEESTIVLTSDLSLLQSQMPTNTNKKSFAEDVENNTVDTSLQMRSIYGVIKVFLTNLHNCTILVKCKIISGTMELHDCTNVKIVVTKEATVATIQCDLSRDITIEFHDAPSGKNTPGNVLYWGQDADDRIFHAGVQNLMVRIYRDDFLEHECASDYIKDGIATAVGNTTLEEFQFITSVVDGALVTEPVVRAGSTTGKNARAMTPREVEAEKKKRERAAELAVAMADDMIQIKDKDGNVLAKKVPSVKENEDILEIVSPGIQETVDECEQNKVRGNEAFGAGEYGQAILLYSLALDKAEELDDKTLFPRDVVLSNRSAAFLKLGQHEKAEADAKMALEINPKNIKANFRRGLALHAMGRYREAIPVLAEAYKIEPNNKQINQALQFCEVRLRQEMREAGL